jgi:phosphopantothenoylcysteine decarboxylase/phosphopantothenate--cysteine ligase
MPLLPGMFNLPRMTLPSLLSRSPTRPFNQTRILLGLTGGIACYKAAELCRQLRLAGAQVQVVMTSGATQFITPLTLQALSGQAVFSGSSVSHGIDGMSHIALTRQTDAIVIAPASADFMAQLAGGHANNLLNLLCLARPKACVPLVLAPAMNKEMWAHPATQRNVKQLRSDGTYVMEVTSGLQACGETGEGRMPEPDDIQAFLGNLLTPQILAGCRVLITAGPTYEAIDPVRGITNRSSGKMGFALAHIGQRLGAEVTLITGPVHLAISPNVTRIDVISAQEMHSAVHQTLALHPFDIFIACAAIADWRPAHTSSKKIKKNTTENFFTTSTNSSDKWIKNPDILNEVSKTPRAKSGQLICIGFAAETENVLHTAQEKRKSKNLAFIVGNHGPTTFGADCSHAFLIDEEGHAEFENIEKEELALEIFLKAKTDLEKRKPENV